MPRPRSSLEAFLVHLHPRTVPAGALRLERTLGAGGVALLLLLLLEVTGTLLLAAYDPSPERARASVVRISTAIPFGGLLRGLHVWAADAAVVVSAVHLLRVLFQGAWLPPRHVNWIVGVVLLGLVASEAFTGALLPWDQRGYWAAHTGTALAGQLPIVGEVLQRALRGGDGVGPGTLALFFGLHVTVLPAALLALGTWHVWLVRRAGGILLPAGAETAPVPASPHLTVRERSAALVVLAVLLLLAALAAPALGEAAIAAMSPDPARAPWFLAGVQELLLHAHPALAASTPIVGGALLAALPLLARGARASGGWFESPRGVRWATRVAFGGAGTAALLVVCDAAAVRPGSGAAEGVWVAVIAAPAVAVAVTAFRSRAPYAGRRLEALHAALAFVLAVALVLTATGAFLRGPGMALRWPGSAPLLRSVP